MYKTARLFRFAGVVISTAPAFCSDCEQMRSARDTTVKILLEIAEDKNLPMRDRLSALKDLALIFQEKPKKRERKKPTAHNPQITTLDRLK